jgi:putative acetyltransferase
MDSHFNLRPAVREDASAIHDLHTLSVTTLCCTHYAPELIAQWIARRTPEGYYPGIDRDEMFVCEAEDQIVGFGHAVPGEVVAIFVHPDHARQGVGSRLLDHALHRARRDHAGPITVIATLNAAPFYAGHGFREVARYCVQQNTVEVPVVEMVLAS